jgi:hypothetical protein
MFMNTTLCLVERARSPGRRAPCRATGFYLAFMAIPLWGLISGGTLTAFADGAVLNTIAVAVAVPALLVLRPGTEVAPEPIPHDAGELLAETAAK